MTQEQKEAKKSTKRDKKIKKYYHWVELENRHKDNNRILKTRFKNGETFTNEYMDAWKQNILKYDEYVQEIKTNCRLGCEICGGKKPLDEQELSKIKHQRNGFLRRFNEKCFIFNYR